MSLLARIRWRRLLFAAVALGSLSQLLDDEPEPAIAGDDLLVNRPWIDHIPTSDRDLVTHFLFLSRDGQRTGLVGRVSSWRQHIELFQWSPRSGAVTLTFPQDNKTAEVKIGVRRCEAPAPLNLCLTVGKGRGSATFYSSTDWSLSTADPSAAHALLPRDSSAAPADALDLDALLK